MSNNIITKDIFNQLDKKYKILNKDYTSEELLKDELYIIKIEKIKKYIEVLYNSISEELYKD